MTKLSNLYNLKDQNKTKKNLSNQCETEN